VKVWTRRLDHFVILTPLCRLLSTT
jgi:hypothetical protein